MKQVVGLMGGLGNQLFQLAFALHISRGQQVRLFPVLKNVRRNALGQPDLMGLSLPENVSIDEEEHFDGWLMSKLMGLGLRISSSDQSAFKARLCSSIASSASPLCGIRWQYSVGLGGETSIRSINSRTLYLGYFQTKEFSQMDRVHRQLMDLRPVVQSKKLGDLKIEAQESGAVMLHVRLTDYLSSGGFGVPSTKFYDHAIQAIFDELGKREIWVFSDDIESARNFLPNRYWDSYRFIESLPDVTHNWELMRYFQGYIIANSSFSWWAAFLRKSQDTPVVSPWPWFDYGGHSKSQLVPGDWLTLNKNL